MLLNWKCKTFFWNSSTLNNLLDCWIATCKLSRHFSILIVKLNEGTVEKLSNIITSILFQKLAIIFLYRFRRFTRIKINCTSNCFQHICQLFRYTNGNFSVLNKSLKNSHHIKLSTLQRETTGSCYHEFIIFYVSVENYLVTADVGHKRINRWL